MFWPMFSLSKAKQNKKIGFTVILTTNYRVSPQCSFAYWVKFIHLAYFSKGKWILENMQHCCSCKCLQPSNAGTKTEQHSVALILKLRTPLSLQMVSAPQNGMALFVGLKDLQESLFLLPVQSICMTSIIKVRLAQDKSAVETSKLIFSWWNCALNLWCYCIQIVHYNMYVYNTYSYNLHWHSFCYFLQLCRFLSRNNWLC